MRAQMEGNTYLEIEGERLKIDDITPDLCGCSLIDAHALVIEKKIGEVQIL